MSGLRATVQPRLSCLASQLWCQVRTVLAAVGRGTPGLAIIIWWLVQEIPLIFEIFCIPI